MFLSILRGRSLLWDILRPNHKTPAVAFEDFSTGLSTNHLSQTTSQQKFAIETLGTPSNPWQPLGTLWNPLGTHGNLLEPEVSHVHLCAAGDSWHGLPGALGQGLDDPTPGGLRCPTRS